MVNKLDSTWENIKHKYKKLYDISHYDTIVYWHFKKICILAKL